MLYHWTSTREEEDGEESTQWKLTKIPSKIQKVAHDALPENDTGGGEKKRKKNYIFFESVC